jgi:hypothetical protein
VESRLLEAISAARTRNEAEHVVAAAAKQYFAERRARAGAFVDRHFSFAGAVALHRRALGWDLLKAPLNIVLAVPYFAAMLTSRAARALGFRKAAEFLSTRRILLETAVAREVEWLVMTELLELPFRQGDRLASKDALAEAVLRSPAVQQRIAEALQGVRGSKGEPTFSDRLHRTIATYADTRAAAAEISATLITLGAGAATLKQITPGALVLGPALANLIAHETAVASFPLGATLGAWWYSVFPVTASLGMTAGLTAVLMAAGAIAAAFSGILADPVQRWLGLHRRRLVRMIDAVERQFQENDGPGFVARDHYVARLLTLLELLTSAYRMTKL